MPGGRQTKWSRGGHKSKGCLAHPFDFQIKKMVAGAGFEPALGGFTWNYVVDL